MQKNTEEFIGKYKRKYKEKCSYGSTGNMREVTSSSKYTIIRDIWSIYREKKSSQQQKVAPQKKVAPEKKSRAKKKKSRRKKKGAPKVRKGYIPNTMLYTRVYGTNRAPYNCLVTLEFIENEKKKCKCNFVDYCVNDNSAHEVKLFYWPATN